MKFLVALALLLSVFTTQSKAMTIDEAFAELNADLQKIVDAGFELNSSGKAVSVNTTWGSVEVPNNFYYSLTPKFACIYMQKVDSSDCDTGKNPYELALVSAGSNFDYVVYTDLDEIGYASEDFIVSALPKLNNILLEDFSDANLKNKYSKRTLTQKATFVKDTDNPFVIYAGNDNLIGTDINFLGAFMYMLTSNGGINIRVNSSRPFDIDSLTSHISKTLKLNNDVKYSNASRFSIMRNNVTEKDFLDAQ